MKYFVATCTALLAPIWASAQTLNNPVGSIGSVNDLVGILIEIVQLIMTPVVVLYIIYAGFKIVTAGGDEKKLSEGKKALIWGAVGATILLGAVVIQEVLVETADDIGISL